MLGADDVIKIDKEAVLGLKPTITTPEALALRKEVDEELRQQREMSERTGKMIEFTIPDE